VFIASFAAISDFYIHLCIYVFGWFCEDREFEFSCSSRPVYVWFAVVLCRSTMGSSKVSAFLLLGLLVLFRLRSHFLCVCFVSVFWVVVRYPEQDCPPPLRVNCSSTGTTCSTTWDAGTDNRDERNRRIVLFARQRSPRKCWSRLRVVSACL
jgi:hypothetical protein